MTFTAEAWESIAGIRAAIEAHPFLTGLHDGTLAREVFLGYLAQDAHYLLRYSDVLTRCAEQAPDTEDRAFWSFRARDAVTVERALHEKHLTGAVTGEPSPTCLAYTSFLAATAGTGSYPALVAAVLPCFWIYDDVGRRFAAHLQPAEHPYGDWIATYGDPAFTASTEQAKRIADRQAHACVLQVRQQMLAAFHTASRYEWMFWDAAWRHEGWPV